jgi:hypothetical protein
MDESTREGLYEVLSTAAAGEKKKFEGTNWQENWGLLMVEGNEGVLRILLSFWVGNWESREGVMAS